MTKRDIDQLTRASEITNTLLSGVVFILFVLGDSMLKRSRAMQLFGTAVFALLQAFLLVR